MLKGRAILLLGLLCSADPASAQKLKIYPITVSVHPSIYPGLTQSNIEKILKDASDLLQKSPNRCGVGFKFAGFVPFPPSAPGSINDAASLEAVHRVPADVKVVLAINYCAFGRQTGIVGCSWRPNNGRKTMIVTNQMYGFNAEHVVFAHEFGHTTGLLHRSDDRDGLMWPCGLDVINESVTKDECRHFLAGPTNHYPPGLGPACPQNR